MKLLTKHHSYFFSLYLPILLITTIIGVYCQAQTISVLISTQWLLILSCGIVLCIAKKTPIHQRQAAKPWMQSMASLCLFQFALWAHLISLYHLSMTTLPVAMPTQAGPYLTQITTNPYYTTLFFPWPFYTLLGLSIAVYCYQPNKQGFLSDATAPIIGNKKNDAISLFINHTNRSYHLAFIVLGAVFCLNLVICVAEITGTSLLFSYNPPGLLFSACVLLPLGLQKPRTMIARLFQYKVPAAVTFCIMLLFLSAYVLALCALYPFIQNAATNPVTPLPLLSLPGTWQQRWTIFMASYALAWAPLAAGLIAHLAQGYSLRQMILMSLTLPIVGTAFLQLPTCQSWLYSVWPAWLELLLSGFSLLTLLSFFYHKKALTAIIRTQRYKATNKMRSAHVLTRSIIFATTILLSLYATTGIQLLSIMLVMLVIHIFYSGLFASASLLVCNDYLRLPGTRPHKDPDNLAS